MRILAVTTLALTLIGCGGPPTAVMPPPPIHVPTANQEVLWERVIDVLHEYHFELAREDRQDGLIETKYKVGASLQEPWHRDAVGFQNRLEGTLQSIRRRVIVRLIPDESGYLVSVEAFKEIEDLDGLAANSAGGATFQEATPLQRDLNVVVGQSAPSGWIPLGRDPLLEHDVMMRLRQTLR